MPVRGRDRFENLSAHGKPQAAPPVRFGDFSVPAAVAWIIEPLGKSPGLRAEYRMRDGEPECISVTVAATERGRGVTTADLAVLPSLDRKGIDAFLAFAVRVFDDEAWVEGRNLDRVDKIYRADRDARTAIRKKPDELLERIAEVYRDNLGAAPLQAVQATFHLGQSTASRRVKEARDRGFLPPTSQGKANA